MAPVLEGDALHEVHVVVFDDARFHERVQHTSAGIVEIMSAFVAKIEDEGEGDGVLRHEIPLKLPLQLFYRRFLPLHVILTADNARAPSLVIGDDALTVLLRGSCPRDGELHALSRGRPA